VNRKSLIPLVAVAFAVAVVSTWVFYGLVAGRMDRPVEATAKTVVVAQRDIRPGATVTSQDVKSITWSGNSAPQGAFSLTSEVVGATALDPIQANEPLTASAVAVVDEETGGVGVPSGMRAISIQVSESEGVLDLLRAGHLVDIQVVRTRGRGNDENVEVRTILESVKVLQVYRKSVGERNELPVVTVLVTPPQADLLAAADSGAKIRLALRNPGDDETTNKRLVSLDRVIRTGTGSVRPAPPQPQVAIDVRVAKSKGSPGLPEAATIADAVAGGYEALSAKRTVVASNQTMNISLQTGDYGLRLRARPALGKDGHVTLKLEPEMTWPEGKGTASRRLEREIELSDGENILVTGLTPEEKQNLVVIVSARRER
jgi:pilus assembly protein CpaB